jgi:hypothetical protein
MLKSVASGARVACNQGSSPSSLRPTERPGATLNQKAICTELDHIPMQNFSPFGFCKILTQLAQGTPTQCAPEVPSPWSGPTAGHSINGLRMLTHKHKCACTVGGEVEISEPANQNERCET